LETASRWRRRCGLNRRDWAMKRQKRRPWALRPSPSSPPRPVVLVVVLSLSLVFVLVAVPSSSLVFVLRLVLRPVLVFGPRPSSSSRPSVLDPSQNPFPAPWARPVLDPVSCPRLCPRSSSLVASVRPAPFAWPSVRPVCQSRPVSPVRSVQSGQVVP
jgi:hypothetical protein